MNVCSIIIVLKNKINTLKSKPVKGKRLFKKLFFDLLNRIFVVLNFQTI